MLRSDHFDDRIVTANGLARGLLRTGRSVVNLSTRALSTPSGTLLSQDRFTVDGDTAALAKLQQQAGQWPNHPVTIISCPEDIEDDFDIPLAQLQH